MGRIEALQMELKHNVQISDAAFQAMEDEKAERIKYNRTHTKKKETSYFAILSQAMLDSAEKK